MERTATLFSVFLCLLELSVSQDILPQCLLGSVCGYDQSSIYGDTRLELCQCRHGDTCDRNWNGRSWPAVEDQVERRSSDKPEDEFNIRHNYRYCQNSLSRSLPADPIPSCQGHPLASSKAYVSFTYHSRTSGAVLAQKDLMSCACSEKDYQYEEQGIVKAETSFKHITVVAKKFACTKLPLCMKDSVFQILVKPVSGGSSDGNVFVDQSCRVTRNFKCRSKSIKTKVTQEGVVSHVSCTSSSDHNSGEESPSLPLKAAPGGGKHQVWAWTSAKKRNANRKK